MRTRNLLMSGILTRQSKLAKLKHDLERKNKGKLLIRENAREKVIDQIEELRQSLRGNKYC